MALRIIHVLHCTEDSKGKKHDKVWGYATAATDLKEPKSRWNSQTHTYDTTPGSQVFVFWGARGKTPQVKEHEFGDELRKMLRSKQQKGYNTIDAEQFDKQYPDVINAINERSVLAALSGDKYAVLAKED